MSSGIPKNHTILLPSKTHQKPSAARNALTFEPGEFFRYFWVRRTWKYLCYVFKNILWSTEIFLVPAEGLNRSSNVIFLHILTDCLNLPPEPKHLRRSSNVFRYVAEIFLRSTSPKTSAELTVFKSYSIPSSRRFFGGFCWEVKWCDFGDSI